MTRPSIYIACGGSGCKTIRSITEVIAQDTALRDSFNDSIFYVLVDTEMDELDKTHRYVSECIPYLEEDHIIKMQTSLNAVSLAPLVHGLFDEKKISPEGLARLKEHWWVHEKSGLPFVAPGVTPLDLGAEQCPPVAYFLAWQMMREIEEKLNTLFDTMIAARSGDVDAHGKRVSTLEGLNYQIITGVAGGTGRGCWELIALKIRKLCMEKCGDAPKPRTLVFDSSVTFGRIANNANKIASKVNALTAFSQMECWNQVKKSMQTSNCPPEGFEYRLPSFTSPENKDTDVLVLGEKDGQHPPVDQVFLIFSGGKEGAVTEDTEYYTMAGRALYAQLKFFEVGNASINSTYFYNSLGASSLEVAAHDLQKHFESGAVTEFLTGLQTLNQPLVEKNVEKFIKTLGLRIAFSSSDPSGLFPSGNEKEFTFWQKIIYELSKKKDASEKSLRENLEEGSDLDALEEQINNYLNLKEADIAQTINTLIQQSGEFVRVLVEYLRKIYNPAQQSGEFAPAAEGYLQKIYSPPQQSTKFIPIAEGYLRKICSPTETGNPNVHRSIHNIKHFLDLFNGEVLGNTGCLNKLPKDIDGIAFEDPITLFHLYKGRSFVVAGTRFDEEEIHAILDACKQSLVRRNYAAIKQQFVKQITAYLAPIAGIRDNAEVIVEQVGHLREKKLTTASYETIFTNPENPATILEDEAHAGCFQRILKPAITQQEFKNYCKDTKVVKLRQGHKIDQLFFGSLLAGSGWQIEDDNTLTLRQNHFSKPLKDAKLEFEEELNKEVSKSIFIAPHFIENTFSLEKVIISLHVAWSNYLKSLTGNQKDMIHALKKFASIFGYKPKINNNNEIKMDTIDQIFPKILASLASTTAPFWKLETLENRKIHILLPSFNTVELHDATLKEAIQLGVPRGTIVEVLSKASNPFIIVALQQECTAGGPATIPSMQYWNEPEVIEQLRLCEKLGDENSIFHPTKGMNGVTFSDPIYINNTVIRSLRWKPWISEIEK